MAGTIGVHLAGLTHIGVGTILGYGEAMVVLAGVDTAGAGTILGDGTVGAGEDMVALAGEDTAGVGTTGAGVVTDLLGTTGAMDIIVVGTIGLTETDTPLLMEDGDITIEIR